MYVIIFYFNSQQSSNSKKQKKKKLKIWIDKRKSLSQWKKIRFQLQFLVHDIRLFRLVLRIFIWKKKIFFLYYTVCRIIVSYISLALTFWRNKNKRKKKNWISFGYWDYAIFSHHSWAIPHSICWMENSIIIRRRWIEKFGTTQPLTYI